MQRSLPTLENNKNQTHEQTQTLILYCLFEFFDHMWTYWSLNYCCHIFLLFCFYCHSVHWTIEDGEQKVKVCSWAWLCCVCLQSKRCSWLVLLFWVDQKKKKQQQQQATDSRSKNKKPNAMQQEFLPYTSHTSTYSFGYVSGMLGSVSIRMYVHVCVYRGEYGGRPIALYILFECFVETNKQPHTISPTGNFRVGVMSFKHLDPRMWKKYALTATNNNDNKT